MFYNKCLLSLFFLLFACSTDTTYATDVSELAERVSKCDERWCISVANPPSSWPSPLKSDTIAVEEHPSIVIEIPPDSFEFAEPIPFSCSSIPTRKF